MTDLLSHEIKGPQFNKKFLQIVPIFELTGNKNEEKK